MRDEHLRLWLCTEKWEEHPNLGNWGEVVAIIQVAFRGGELMSPYACHTVVIISKGEGTKCRGFSLVEVFWKAISCIIDHWILSYIQFHDALHRFHAGRLTGTATLE